MRQRRPKNLEEKLYEHAQYLIDDPQGKKNNWRSVFEYYQQNLNNDINKSGNDKPLFLEIGCGKGRFINELATRNPNDLFIGIEGQDTVILRALEKIKCEGLRNIKMCQYYIMDFSSVFGRNELDGIYLNFSDPWPKDRHEKRRLTSPRYLNGYSNSLKPNAFIKIKTDNHSLFQYSFNQLENHDEFEILEYTEDLHSSPYNEKNILTEYEAKFTNLNKKIKYICAKRK